MTHDQPFRSDSSAATWYFTTAIPYVNARPHIGFALECVLTDALARYRRHQGADVRFLSGTDENSLKNVQAAEREGISVQALVDRNAEQFRALRDVLDLSFDDFIRTSVDQRHRAGVQKLWLDCERNGDIYKRRYSGLYCVGCEQFYAEDELLNGLCPEHLTPPELIEEENYFFRLSRYTQRLLELIETDRLAILPATRKNEVLSFIRRGLQDFSISRSQARAHGWGIAVPGDPEQVVYVWFDALVNYITALAYADDSQLYRQYWAEPGRRVHVIGKGITRFHAIYWPAMLLSAGVPLPSDIFVHGYVTVAGQKISKSLGNVVDPVALATEYGADALRHYLLREIRSTEDGDFTIERFVQSYNAHLADGLGNLLSRVLGMLQRYFNGEVPRPSSQHRDPNRRLIAMAEALAAQVERAMDQYAPHEALAAIWDFVGAANKYVIEVQPWQLAKRRELDAEADEQLRTALYNLVEALRIIASFTAPYLPSTAAAIMEQLGLDRQAGATLDTAARWGVYPAGTVVQPAAVLFPKRELAVRE